jgi:hypothetical protein
MLSYIVWIFTWVGEDVAADLGEDGRYPDALMLIAHHSGAEARVKVRQLRRD